MQLIYKERGTDAIINADDRNVTLRYEDIAPIEKNTTATVGERQYLIAPPKANALLREIGIMGQNGKIKNDMVRKYNQIDHFVELVDPMIRKLCATKKQIRIIDCGCGKSYLTFIVYYYFTEIKKVKAKVIGYDLKEDVVKNCNEIARRYGYTDLKFYVNDVTKGELYEGEVDMVITLHACDIATDFALYHAIENGVPHIFSVPCCQHEICSSIKKGGDYDLLLSHGLIKERFSALLTDSIRAELLKECGYEVDIIEFVDFAHSPKNLMLRCKLKKKKAPQLQSIKELTEKYGFTQKLFELIVKEK